MTVPGRRVGLFVLLVSALPAILLADGGTVQFQRQTGPFVVTLFSSPAPLRTGSADLSVLVETIAGNQPVLDATVRLRLQQGNKHIEDVPTHAQATNKLLYAANPDLPTPGDWRAIITIERAGQRWDATGAIEVLPGPPAFVFYWPYFALVPLLIALFVLNQRLKRRGIRG